MKQKITTMRGTDRFFIIILDLLLESVYIELIKMQI
jgi:hypothetical protein